MCKLLSRGLLALAAFVWFAGSAHAQTISGAFAEGSGTSVSVSRTITANRGQFLLITASAAVTCSTPTGWTALTPQTVFGTQTYCPFYILSSTGSESQSSTLNTTAAWTISSWEASVAFSSHRESATAESDLITATAGPISATTGDLIISAIGNEVAFVASTPPSGYTAPIPSGSSVNHYGTNTAMMGAVAYTVAVSTGSISAVWTHDQAVFAGVGVHAFVPAAGGGGGGSISTLLGVGR